MGGNGDSKSPENLVNRLLFNEPRHKRYLFRASKEATWFLTIKMANVASSLALTNSSTAKKDRSKGNGIESRVRFEGCRTQGCSGQALRDGVSNARRLLLCGVSEVSSPIATLMLGGHSARGRLSGCFFQDKKSSY
jgi:hypothetical protein